MTLVAFSCCADGCGFETTKVGPGNAIQQLDVQDYQLYGHVVGIVEGYVSVWLPGWDQGQVGAGFTNRAM